MVTFPRNRHAPDDLGRPGVLLGRLRPKGNGAVLPVIAGLFAHFDASDASTITESAGSVSRWDDKSGDGNNVLEGVTVDMPLTGTRMQNSKNLLEWTGGDCRMQSASLTGGDIAPPITVVTVASYDDPTSGAQRLFNMTDASETNVASIQKRDNANGNILRLRGGSQWIASSQVPDANVHMYSGVYNGASSELFFDRVSIATGNIGAPATIASGVLMGAGNGPNGNNLDGGIGEFLAYSKVLDAGELASVWTYLEERWGL